MIFEKATALKVEDGSVLFLDVSDVPRMDYIEDIGRDLRRLFEGRDVKVVLLHGGMKLAQQFIKCTTGDGYDTLIPVHHIALVEGDEQEGSRILMTRASGARTAYVEESPDEIAELMKNANG